MAVQVKRLKQHDRRLGRHMVHDDRSRGFALPPTIDKSTWRDKSIRIYDPIPNPNQPVGCCTMCAKAMEFNAVGNRVTGRVLGMDWSLERYRLETSIDEFAGQWEPDDTGSSSLASCKTVQQTGEGGKYLWLLNGADQVVQTLMGDATNPPQTVNVGTVWKWDMFNQDADGRVIPGGGDAGGHQYIARGYWKSRDWILFRCWWGDFRDFWMAREDFNTLLLDGGDAHVQKVRLTA